MPYGGLRCSPNPTLAPSPTAVSRQPVVVWPLVPAPVQSLSLSLSLSLTLTLTLTRTLTRCR